MSSEKYSALIEAVHTDVRAGMALDEIREITKDYKSLEVLVAPDAPLDEYPEMVYTPVFASLQRPHDEFFLSYRQTTFDNEAEAEAAGERIAEKLQWHRMIYLRILGMKAVDPVVHIPTRYGGLLVNLIAGPIFDTTPPPEEEDDKIGEVSAEESN